jgi:hypothetical protein
LLLSPRFSQLIRAIDNFWFIYPQSFRILREFILLLLLRYMAIPEQMTFEGRNYDVLIGITAPFVAYYWFKKKMWYKPLTLIWNILGLCFIVYAISTLFFIHPFRSLQMHEHPIVFTFPFVWFPAFLSPFAIFLHLLSIKKILQNDELPSEKQ